MPSPSFRSMPPMGQVMLERGVITSDQLQLLLDTQSQHKQRVGEAAVSSGFITDLDLAKFLAAFYELPYVELNGDEELDPSVCELVPETIARRYQVLPL